MFSEWGIMLPGPFGVEPSSDHAVARAAVYSVGELSKQVIWSLLCRQQTQL